MNIQLTPSWVLTDESGSPRLLQRVSGDSYSPEDTVQLYPSWDHQPARVAVRRAAKLGDRSADEQSLIESFCATETKQAHIHIRTTMDRKTTYVKAAQREGKTLSEWITAHCDAAARDC